MRWNGSRPQVGATRTVTKFAWLPVKIDLQYSTLSLYDYTKVWLERYFEDETYTYSIHGDYWHSHCLRLK